MKPIVFQEDAEAEFVEAIAYYEAKREGLGRDLRDEVEAVVSLIQRNPKLGGPYKGTEFRHFTIRRFPYVLYYVELDDTIWIAAVAHGRRRPDYWRARQIG